MTRFCKAALFSLLTVLPAAAFGAAAARGGDAGALRETIRRRGYWRNGEVDHFAVLIGGGTELRHRGNLSLAYQVLLEEGYDPSRIFVLDPDGPTPIVPVTDKTTLASVRLLFKHLEEVVEEHDTLLLYVTGHGSRIEAPADADGRETSVAVNTLELNRDEAMDAVELGELLGRLNPAATIAFFDECYGGIFQRLGFRRSAVLTVAPEERVAVGMGFPRAFWNAFRSFREERGRRASIGEAFREAMVRDRATRKGLNRPRLSTRGLDAAELTLLGSPFEPPKDPARPEDGAARLRLGAPPWGRPSGGPRLLDARLQAPELRLGPPVVPVELLPSPPRPAAAPPAAEGANPRKTSLLEATVYTGLPALAAVSGVFAYHIHHSGMTSKDIADSYKYGFTHPPVWDPNPWYVNYVGHPLFGSESYLLARNRGHSPMVSFIYSSGASVAWEYAIEPFIGARPSVQDLLFTSTIGSALGELRYWAKNRLMKNEDDTLSKVGVVLLDPIDAVYRAAE